MRTDDKVKAIKRAPSFAAQVAIALDDWNEREVPSTVKQGVSANRPLLFDDFKQVLNAAFCSTNHL